jgi:hypothetical protein
MRRTPKAKKAKALGGLVVERKELVRRSGGVDVLTFAFGDTLDGLYFSCMRRRPRLTCGKTRGDALTVSVHPLNTARAFSGAEK